MGEQPYKGEVALVTGANKGIGYEIVRRLAAEGMTVYLGARDEWRGRQAERELAGPDADVRFVHLDVTDQSQVDAAAKHVGQESGRLSRDPVLPAAASIRTVSSRWMLTSRSNRTAVRPDWKTPTACSVES